MLFGNPETHSKAVITTSTLSDKSSLYLFLQHPSGIGEENVSLESCFSNGEIDPRYMNEIQYFTKMLELFSDMCTGRNYICKASIKDWFPIQILVSNIWNEELSPDIRAAFLKLMLNMHVDSQPRQETSKPELIRVLGLVLKEDQKVIHRQRHSVINLDSNLDLARRMGKHFTQMKNDIIILNEDKNDEFIVKFVEDEIVLCELKERVIEFLQAEGIEPLFNVLTHQVLKMGRQLAKFELLGAACSNVKEGFCILDPKHPLFNYESMDLIRLLKVVKPLLLFGYDQPLSRNTHISNASKTTKKTKESFESLLNKLLHEANSLGDPVVRYSDNLRNFIRSILADNEFSEAQRSYENKCKIEICQLLHYVLDWRQDFLLNNVVCWFNSDFISKNARNEREIKCLFPPLMPTEKQEAKGNFLNININLNFEIKSEPDPEFKAFLQPEIKDLSCIGSEIITKLLKLFCISPDYKMQSLLISLILRSFNQRTELVKNVKKLHVMTLLQDTEVFTWTKTSLFTFKQLSEQSELWMKYWAQTEFLMEKNLEKLETVQAILDKFSIIMYRDTTIEDGMPLTGLSAKIDKDRQIMCYYLYLHKYLVHLLKDGMFTIADIYDDSKNSKEIEGRGRLLKLFQSCYTVLTTMVKKNPKIQKKLYNEMSTFTAFLRIPVGQVELICEIFRDNTQLCSSVKDNFIMQFIDLIITEGRQGRFLQVFEVIQSPCSTPIPDVQRMVLLHLLDPNHLNHVCYMNKDSSGFLFDPLANPPLFSPHYKDEPIIYHSVFVEVLTKCGQGASGIYLTEAKCQKIISLKQIFLLLNIDDTHYHPLQIPLLKFFFHIYLDSEQKVDELENSKDFVMYINKLTTNMGNLNEESRINLEFFESWIDILYAYSEKYIDDIQGFKLNNDVDALCGFLDVLNSKWEFYSKLKISEKCLNKLEALGNRYNFIFPKTSVTTEDVEYTQFNAMDGSENKDKWLEFKNIFLYSDSLKPMLSQEHQALYDLVFDIELIEPSLNSGAIYKKLIQFIKQSTIYKPPIYVIVNVLRFLSSILGKVRSDKEENKQEAIDKLQNEFCEYDAAKIVLGLMCDRDTEIESFNALLLFAIRLLEGGNEKAQQDFYQFFITMSSSNVFFERLYMMISEYIEKCSYLEDIEKLPIYKSPDLKITLIMKLLQLLCENHNKLLQNYLRVQTNSRSNNDMVSLTIVLLEELMKKKRYSHFLIISQCFDTLTEYIQGPCRENQKAIIDSRFLEVASGLLSIDEKSDCLAKYENLVGESGKATGKSENCLSGWMIAHLKYKCMITIQSLLEGQIDNYVITRMIRALNIEIFKENLISLYLSYLDNYHKSYYDYSLFQHYDENDDFQYGQVSKQDTKPGYYQFIIETGFMIYHLMCYFKDNDDPENKAIIENELPELMIREEASNFMATKLIGDLGKMGLSFLKSGFSVVTRLAGSKKAKVAMNEEDRKKALEEAYSFFQQNSGNVEIIFSDKKLFKVYFWIPPECHHLTPDSKDLFHNTVDRSSDKAKIQFLIQKAPEMIEEMQHEFRLSKFYNKYKLVSFLTSHVTVWKEVAFFATLIQNFFIIASYYENESGDRLSPWMFYENSAQMTVTGTNNALRIIGILQCVCSVLIVTFFIMKTAPVLIKRGWRKHQRANVQRNCLSSMIYKIKGLFLTLYFTLSNIDVLYHLLYMLCSVFGIIVNPLFFSLNLLDILYRYPSLQNVIKSIVLPRKSLLLTFILILILIYLFSIWAYLSLSFYYGGNCDNMIECIKTTFDQGIKNGGGIGQYFDQLGPEIRDTDTVLRFFFDDLFNIIIMIIMMNIIQGIIIDTFAVLREQSDRNTADRETKCFVCGKDKEYIERCTNRPFRYHCVHEHNEWNYLYFIAYLNNKESTEHTGIESTIHELVKEKDISWIPQQQGLTLKDVDDTEELQMHQKIESISQTYDSLQKEMKDVKKYFYDYLESKVVVNE